MRTALDKLSNEFDGVGEIAVQNKSVEQFRQELVDAFFQAIAKETGSSIIFTKNGDYYNARLAEAKVEGLHKALGIILEAATIVVK